MLYLPVRQEHNYIDVIFKKVLDYMAFLSSAYDLRILMLPFYFLYNQMC